ncbi:adenine DNA glycosylase isoform X2 [Tripterygium wilfordii]|uniref:adenine DNA glycosylase isoform X2 n=1 Tax=Tripterygium wilfordii TaxID=458696 RepID=UPI0018F816C1|nr:adenine DNA glycosylase isoform X2 [Tripterygium wilfordii]
MLGSVKILKSLFMSPSNGFEFSTVTSRDGTSSSRVQPNRRNRYSPFSVTAMESRQRTKKRTVRQLKKTQNLETQQDDGKEVGDIEDIAFTSHETLKIRASMLDWYHRNRRDLPWRRRNSNSSKNEEDEEGRREYAYRVWVSEVMLQQTRVQTVIDYYNRWMVKWPTLHHLAQASLEEVNEMWAGLGYYRRGRFLLEGAKMIIAGGGEFPDTVSSLRKVRGIGDYTAGAIASIAFKEVVPVVDGNVIRVLARLKAISDNPKDPVTMKNFWKLAAQLVDPGQPGDFNQSLMELGATVCTPLNPTCSSCPVSVQCRALSISKQDRSVLVTNYPAKVIKAKQRHDFSAVCVVKILRGEDKPDATQSDGEFLLVKRPDEGLLAGLWEFPSVMMNKEANITTRRKAIDQYLKQSFKLDPKKTCSVVLREDVGGFVHVFTHIRLQIYVEFLSLHLKGGMHDLIKEQDIETRPWKLVDDKVLSNLGLTSAVRKSS